jgi:hypothetical protein
MLAFPFAESYYEVLSKLESEINKCIWVFELMPLINLTRETKKPEEKIMLNITVETLGTIARVLWDFHIVRANSKMRLCRMIAATFQTTRQSIISAASLYHNMADPDTETVRKLLADCGKIAKKFYDRNS